MTRLISRTYRGGPARVAPYTPEVWSRHHPRNPSTRRSRSRSCNRLVTIESPASLHPKGSAKMSLSSTSLLVARVVSKRRFQTRQTSSASIRIQLRPRVIIIDRSPPNSTIRRVKSPPARSSRRHAHAVHSTTDCSVWRSQTLLNAKSAWMRIKMQS